MKKVHLGLDLGIASVGWSLVDENQKIIATGAHLFSKLSDPQNNTKYGEGVRGSYRRIRRMNNRKKQRKIDFLNMIDLYNDNQQNKIESIGKESKFYNPKYQDIFGFSKSFSSSDFLFLEAKKYDVYKIWKKGFNQELNPKELFCFLYFKLGMRGVFFKDYEFQGDKYTYNDSLLKQVFEEKYLLENGKFRSKSNGDYTFSIKWNWQDIQTILKNCSYIDEEFINDYKNIFMRYRDYAYGPGSFKQISPWGIQEFDDEGKPKNTLWESRIGLCPISLYDNNGNKDKTERRISQYLLISEFTNLISQLINVRIGMSASNANYLSKENIIKIINQSIIRNKKVNLKMISNVLGEGIDENNIFGFPTDKEDKTKSNFESLLRVRKYFHDEKIIKISFENLNIEKMWETLIELDLKRFEIIKKYFENQKISNDKNHNKLVKNNKDFYKSKKELENYLSKINFQEYEVDCDNLANFNSVTEIDLFGTKKFGWNAYYKYLQSFFNEDIKAKSISHFYKKEIHEGKKLLYSFSKSKYLPENMFKNQEFISPNSKNTMKEAIRIINRVLKMYVYKNEFNLKSIIIETTYDSKSINDSLLSKDKRDELIKLQKFNESEKNKAIEFLKENNLDFSSKEMIEKGRLWLEQKGGWDVYQNKTILPQEIKDSQIDHIIPYEISFNNNWENKVLTLKNSSKSKMIPKSFLSNEEFNILSKKWKEIYNIKDELDNKSKTKISLEQKIKNLKYQNLTMSEVDLERKHFISSNLSETTYAISKLKEGLDFWFEEIRDHKDILELNKLKECDIRTISGFQSQLLRKEIFNCPKKNRNISNHHSHDASLIAIYSSIKEIDDFYDSIKKSSYEYVMDRIKSIKYNNFDTKKLISIKNLKQLLNNKLPILRNEILNSNCYFSFKKISILSNKFKDKGIEDKWNEIKSINPKQIFANELPNSHVEINNKKYQITKLNLLDEKDAKKINLIFYEINKRIKNIIDPTEKKIKKEIQKFCENENKECKFKKIITSYDVIFNLYKCISSSFTNDTFDEDVKKYKTLFKKYNSENLDKIPILIDSRQNFNTLMNTYVPIIKNNASFSKVKEIRIINIEEYIPTFEKRKIYLNQNEISNKTKQNITNKQIFNISKSEKMLINTSLYGDSTKLYAVIKYVDDLSKERIGIFKINQLNKITRGPKREGIIEFITFIDPNKWYLIKNHIYRISNFNFDKRNIASHKLEVYCVSDLTQNKINKSSGNIIGISKSFSSWSKSENEIEKEIFKKIICQNLNIV